MEIFKQKVRKRNKKGSVLDLVYLVPVLFVLIIITFFVHKAWNEMSPQLQQEEFLDTNEGAEGFQKVTDTVNGFNLLIPFIFILSIIVIIISAYVVKVSPGFYIIGLLVFIVLVILSIMFSNAFNEFSTESDLQNETLTYAAPVMIMQQLPKLIVVAGFLVMIAVYAKYRSGGST